MTSHHAPATRRRIRPRADFVQALEPRLLLADASLVMDINRTTDMLDPANLFVAGGVGYFAGRSAVNDGRELWRTDGTTAGTVRVKDINPGPAGSDPQRFAAVGNTVFLAATDAAAGTELWKTDGTAAGTVRVKDVRPGSASANPNNLTAVGNTLFFAADDGTGGVELWKSDGTAAGTVRVRDIRAGAASSNPAWLVNLGGTLVFTADGGGRELWHSDGTAAGTSLVTDLSPAAGQSNPRQLTVMGDAVYFTADGGGGFTSPYGDLYKTDGTAAGTSLVKTINYTTAGDSTLAVFTVSGDLLYFLAGPLNTGGYDLWRTDGTDAGTVRLVSGPAFSVLAGGTRLLPAGDHSVVFANKTSAAGLEPWASDGTVAGTRMLADVVPGTADGVSASMPGARAGATTYFMPSRTIGDTTLWKTDGTPAGTSLVEDVTEAGEAIYPLGAFGDVLLFGGLRWVGEGDLYRSDGTAAGTYRVGAASPPAGNGYSMRDGDAYNESSPAFARAGDRVYFQANDGIHGDELWRTIPGAPDGAAAEMVADLVPGGGGSGPAVFTIADDGTLYFTAETPATGRELYRLSPAAGAVPQLVRDLLPGPNGSFPRGLSPVGNLLYFTARNTAVAPNTLWRFDPATGAVTQATTASGQVLLGWPEKMTRFGDAWYFTAATADLGAELYRTDGTTAGTRLVRDIVPGADSSAPQMLTPAGNALYFATSNPEKSLYEWWKTDGTEAGTVRLADFEPNHITDTVTGLVALGPYAFLSRNSVDPNTRGVWRSDGTPGGTLRLADVDAPQGLVAAGGKLFVMGAENDTDYVVYSVDPATGAKSRVTNSVLAGGFAPTHLYPAGDTLYAVGYGQTGGVLDGFELWEIDPAAAGPDGARFVQELGTNARGAASAGYWGEGREALFADGQYLYFPASTPGQGMEPYRLPLAGVAPVYEVVGRHVFYNQSAFDGQDPLPGPADDAAIATDKRALLPGQAASPANVSSFSRGINGIMFDVTPGLPLTALAGLAGNVGLQTSPGDAAGPWADAPRPAQVAIRPGAGGSGSDRVTLIWPDGAIKNAWLKVTVPALPAFGLMTDDVFLFGNLAGETGDAGSPFRVSALDLGGVKRVLNNTATVSSPFDINRDGRINALDLAAVKANLNHGLAAPAGLASPAPAPPPLSGQAGGSNNRVWDETPAPLL